MSSLEFTRVLVGAVGNQHGNAVTSSCSGVGPGAPPREAAQRFAGETLGQFSWGCGNEVAELSQGRRASLDGTGSDQAELADRLYDAASMTQMTMWLIDLDHTGTGVVRNRVRPAPYEAVDSTPIASTSPNCRSQFSNCP
jgi:hypothetical protein